MGAWGVDPFDNDSALDWLGAFVARPIVREIELTLMSARWGEEGGRAGYHEALAAAALLLRLTEPKTVPDISYDAINNDVFDKGIDALTRIFADKQWADTWNSPRAIRRVIDNLIRGLCLRRDSLLKEQKKAFERFRGRTVPRRKRRPKAQKSPKNKGQK
jgi:Domain of unknown function (DUF4259)